MTSKAETSSKKRSVGRPKEWSTKQLVDIGQELIIWCHQPGNWHVCGFEVEKNLPLKFCRNMAQRRREEFGDLYTRAKQVLGHKILQQSMEGRADRWVVSTLTPKYLDDIDEYLTEKKEKEVLMLERVKRSNETQVEANAVALIEAMNRYVLASADSGLE